MVVGKILNSVFIIMDLELLRVCLCHMCLFCKVNMTRPTVTMRQLR